MVGIKLADGGWLASGLDRKSYQLKPFFGFSASFLRSRNPHRADFRSRPTAIESVSVRTGPCFPKLFAFQGTPARPGKPTGDRRDIALGAS